MWRRSTRGWFVRRYARPSDVALCIPVCRPERVQQHDDPQATPAGAGDGDEPQQPQGSWRAAAATAAGSRPASSTRRTGRSSHLDWAVGSESPSVCLLRGCPSRAAAGAHARPARSTTTHADGAAGPWRLPGRPRHAADASAAATRPTRYVQDVLCRDFCHDRVPHSNCVFSAT